MQETITKSQKGFSLIELMIVVAIIGILSAIAIPNFLQYQLKAKTSEARINIGGIKTTQLAYKAEYNIYVACAKQPATTASASKHNWGMSNTGFQAIGFKPSGQFYYTYQVAVAVTGREMAIDAAGNLDGDATAAYYTLSSDEKVQGGQSGIVSAAPWTVTPSGDDF